MLEVIQTVIIVMILGILIWQQREIAWKYGKQRVILDSCALIDGRILELAKSSFISGQLIIPKFVLDELQLLADGSDSQKRERARFGLEVAYELQQEPKLSVLLDPYLDGKVKATDAQLIELAKKRRAQLYTTDYNLNKRASVEGVSILNINELAQIMRPPALPGEVKAVKILQKGSNQGQGVGYLDDGTMVVVDNASKRIGKVVEVRVTRVLQTAAGKMIFANLQKR